MARATMERDAGGEQRLGQLAAGGDAQAAVIEESAAALLGPEPFVAHPVEDHTGDQVVVARHADRDGEMLDAVPAIRCSVGRIGDSLMLAVPGTDWAPPLPDDHTLRGGDEGRG